MQDLSKDPSQQSFGGEERQELSLTDKELADAKPEHVVIIMDGNHRWASARHLPGAAGHRAGAKRLRPIAEACAELGVKHLTVFAFSTENWYRPDAEVGLLNAAKTLAQQVANGTLLPEEVNENAFASAMSLTDIPEPDLMIRTGGDHRISNFLLWDLAYTELYFTDIFWPDFDAAALQEAVATYAQRKRRFGRRQ